MPSRSYHRPPDDYEPPTHCEACSCVIMYGPVIGGHIWSHVARADHDVVMRPEGWWDTASGTIRYGNGRAELVEPAEPPPASATAVDLPAGRVRCDMRVERDGASWDCDHSLPCPEHPWCEPPAGTVTA